MIARLRGVAVGATAESIVLDVGGVGYRLHATPRAIQKADARSEVELETHLHVREDALQLYGFADGAERELFELLLAVNGVGPKVALAIVSGYGPSELRRAIVREDAALFETIPGIGRKTAQRVVLELKEKIAPLVAVPSDGGAPAGDDEHTVARDALVELGLSVAEAEKRLADTDPDLPAAERVRQALRAA
jgi:Holliday junction DNA helicase RuvA